MAMDDAEPLLKGGGAVASMSGMCLTCLCCVKFAGCCCAVIALGLPVFGFLLYTRSCWSHPRCIWLQDVPFTDTCPCDQQCVGLGCAAEDPSLGEFKHAGELGAVNWGHWFNWGNAIETCTPWLMPSDDEGIRRLLRYAQDKGYKVRPGGASHSAGGLVTEKGEADQRTIVVSLAKYKAQGEWEFDLREDGPTASVTVNAGWTQLDLWARIRPKDLFVPGQTAGYFFQLAGIVANSVHGGAYREGFIHDLVTRMRVMLWNGTVKVLDREEDLRYWRNSYGLLGIILGVELPLVRREAFQIYATPQRTFNWSEEEFWNYIKHDGEADIPDGVPAGGHNTSGSRKGLAGEFFVEFLSVNEAGDNAPRAAQMIGVCQKWGANATEVHESGEPVIKRRPDGIEQNYGGLLDSTVHDRPWGLLKYSEAARASGFPRLQLAEEAAGVTGSIPDELDMHAVLSGLRQTGAYVHLDTALMRRMAPMLSGMTLTTVPTLIDKLRRRVNDGFFLTNSPVALISAWFLKPEKAFEAMDFLAREQLLSLNGDGAFVWNQPAEFRFVTVKDSAVLQPVEPGFYFNSEFLSFPSLEGEKNGWEKAFKKVQDYWVDELGGRPHMGKYWGFAEVDGNVVPFADSEVCKVYSESRKKAFNDYRKQQDPHGLFAAGLGMRLLGPCSEGVPAAA